MRVLGIADVDYVHTRKWATYLASRGHEVRLVSFQAVTSAKDYPGSVVIESWHLPSLHLKRFWITLAAIIRLRRTAAEFRPHVVQVHFLGAGAWYAALARLHPLAVWVMGGDITGVSWRPNSVRESLMSRLALWRADLVISWSKHLRGLVAPFLRKGALSEVVVGGVDVDLFRPHGDKRALRQVLGLPPEAFLLLSPRLVWPLYNIDVIVAALAHLRAAVPHARLVLLRYTSGRFPQYQAAIDRQIEMTGQSDHVIMVPPLPQADVARYLAAVDCTVSIPDTDGTPMSVLESLASGTPVVVHDLEQYDDELFAHEQSVLRVPLRDPKALAEAMLRIHREPGLGRQMAVRGRELVVRRANYEVEMSRLVTLYESLVAREAASIDDTYFSGRPRG